MKVANLHQLYVHELKDLYSAETQLIQALPQMAKAAQTADLRTAFKNHLKETQQQAKRLEKIFKGLEYAPGGQSCDGMTGLIKEGASAISEMEAGVVRDAALIAAAQRVEHYEMAGYGTARAFAKALGRDEDVVALSATFEEEAAADSSLTSIASLHVNRLAKLQEVTS